MTDSNQIYDTIMRERNNLVISDTDKTNEEQGSLSLHDEADLDDIPPSLLSYFETSRSRAALCEKLILEELEDFSESAGENQLNEQVTCDTENEENNTSTDTRLLPAPTGTEALLTHNVPVCPNNKDEAGTDEYMEISLNEEERKKGSEYEAEREKRHYEEMKKEEQKRQIERDFQKELKKIMALEKLHQKELELMQKRAQEKLDQELLLQQELISNLQRRVEEERRRREEEQMRMKDEEDKRKREEDKMKIEAERKIMEEETRRKKEEERKIEEMKLKNEEEEKRRMEREEKRKREEERNKMDLEKKKLEDEMRMMKEEEETKKKEEIERIKKEEEGKREEERKNIEEARKKMEKEKREMEAEMTLKKEEEERQKREEENMRIEEEGKITKEIEERKKQVEMRKKKEEEEADDRKKIYEELRKRDKREHGDVDEQIKPEERKKKEEKDSKKREEEKEEDDRKMEKERKKEGDRNRKRKEELRPIEEDERRKKEDERKTKEEEQRRQKEEMGRKRDKEDYRKSEEEISLTEDNEGYKRQDVDNIKMEHESKTKDKEKRQEEERKNVEAEKEQNEEEVGENKEVDKKTEEEIRLIEKEESKKRMVQDREKEVRVLTANELQEKGKKREHKSMIGQNEKKNTDKTEKSLASQLEDTWTSSSPGSLHSESAICPTSTETTPQQHDLDKSISQSSIDKTMDCENQAARPSTAPVVLPMCLPEHTEQKRLSWMKDCIPWSKLSLQNRRKQKGSVQSRRVPRRAAEASSLPPLCPDSLLRSTGWKSLQEVTTMTLEDLPGCSLSTLAHCVQLRSLTLRRCGLRSLEGINQLPQLCYIDVQENDISFVDCENMTSLRVLQLSRNKLTSVHGLTGAENLDFLDLSHNSITRIAGLESMRRLQRLSVDHNQLISTKGLRDVYTLLHLNCSHNHLASVEGLENSALLSTLDLRANSLTEPPSLNNQVLLRELHLDDNSISSLEAISACWLPLMQHLSVAQNRITQLPSMSDSVSLANLDLRFNCMSELHNVCESLEGCQSLREVRLTGNPLEQESGWRSTLQKAVPGLRAINNQETDSFLSPPAVQQVNLAVGSFLTFCQAQLQQTHDLQQRHSRERSNASSSLDAVKTSCRHFAEALQLAKDQRSAHEYGDTTMAAGHTITEETLDMDSTNLEKRTERSEMESNRKVPPIIPNRDNIRCSCNWTFEEKSAAESRHNTFDTVTSGPKTGPTVTKANSVSVHSLAAKGTTTFSNLEMALMSNHQDLDLQNTAAVVIQQLWRKYRQKCGKISNPSTAEKGGGDGGKPESGPSYSNRSQDYAATVIQAFWRGFTLRRRLASALAAVTCLDTGEDDTFEEVDVDEFVFDEAALEKHWTLPLSEDSPPRRYPDSEQPLSLKPPGPFPEPPQYILPPPPVWRSKQAWVAGEQVDSASPVSSIRSKSPASASVVSGLSERSEKILEEWGFTHSHTALLMLKRAQKMKSKKQQQKKHRDPSVHLGLFRNCSYQLGPVEARNRPAQHNRNDIKVREVELGLQQAEKTERAKQWLHTQAAHSDRDSESVHFLPEISSDILNGGRVQLVADPGYTERLHHASGLWANNSLAAQPCKENSYPRRNLLGHARKEVPSPKRVTSAPSKKERISFRDNPVQLSAGWGGGKKRDKV